MTLILETDRETFTFTWQGLQYTFTRLPQGFKHSPTIAHATLAKELETLKLPQEVTVVQYIDDVLIGGRSAEPVKQAMDTIITHPQSTGVEVPEEKKQGPSQEVTFLGVRWIGGRKTVPAEVLQEIQQLPIPENKKELRAVLGTLGFWRARILGFSIIVRPLYNLLKKNAIWEWTPQHEEALKLLKENVNAYQSLRPIHPMQPLSLHIQVGEKGYWWGLWQQGLNGSKELPITFGSKSWQNAQHNCLTFEKVLLAAYEGLVAAEPLTQGRSIKFYMPIAILKPVIGGKPLPLCVAHETTVKRWALYIHHYVTADGLTKENKVTEAVEHIGMPTEYMEPPCSPIQDVPEFNPRQPDGVWFTDGNAHKIQGKQQGTAAAVSVADEYVVTERIEGSAQLVELYATVLALRNGTQAIVLVLAGIEPMTHTSEGWKFIITGVEIVSDLGNVYPTRTASGLGTVGGLNQWFAVHPKPQEIQSDKTQITATCWGLAYAYRALFNTLQYPQGEEKVWQILWIWQQSDRHCGYSRATCDRHHGYFSLATDTAVEPGNKGTNSC
ncbi:hypothetical protein QYF61_018425, partial [Mycteria americana]